MVISVSLERVGEEDVVGLLFGREDSKRAARMFLDWLKNKGGTCSKSEMNQFSRRLQSGELGYSLSRTNFYKSLVHRFLDLGLIAEQPQYDYKQRRIVKVYRAVIQPISKRRPMAPSLTYLAHIVAEKWNAEFTKA